MPHLLAAPLAARNLDVIRVLRRYGLAEDAGRGVDVMQDTMRSETLEQPEFRDTGHSVSPPVSRLHDELDLRRVLCVCPSRHNPASGQRCRPRVGRLHGEVELPTKITSLMRAVLNDELRRLVGRRRRPRRGMPEAWVPAVETAATEPAAVIHDSWASQVLDHAERTIAEGPAAAPPTPGDATPFERLDLGELPDAVAHLVRTGGSIPERDLLGLVRSELMLGALPANYERLLGRLIWSAKGRGMIDLREGTWVAGPVAEGTIAELEGQSLDSLARLGGELRDHDATEDGVFQAMIAELAGEGERAPRIVATVVGVALGLARRRGYLAYGQWGQGSLLSELDGK